VIWVSCAESRQNRFPEDRCQRWAEALCSRCTIIDDDRTHRSREEVEEWKARDAIPNYRRFLEGEGLLDEEKERGLRRKATSVVDNATEFADEAPFPRVDAALVPVFSSQPGLGR
jgi:TPP-dependent pyruvate/acetoin dehydrogenase alpha subunit